MAGDMPSATDKARELAALMGRVECEGLLRDALMRRDAQWRARLDAAKAAGKIEGRAEMKAEAVGVCREVETGRVTTARSCADAIEALE